MKIIVGITGATGIIYAASLLEALSARRDVETHLVVSEWGKKTLTAETPFTLAALEQMAESVYDYNDLGAPISSGSFKTDGMVVVPCSMKTLSAVAHGYDDNLIARAAGVSLKEGRKLVLCPRETPLSAIHLENMLRLAQLGVAIVPPMPAFYAKPQSIGDLVAAHTTKVLDQFGIETGQESRWRGIDESTKGI